MFELVHALLLVVGIAAARLVDASLPCAEGPCPPALERPIEAWGPAQPLRADAYQLFSRGDHRPGQPAAAPIVLLSGDRVRVVGRAPERLRPVLFRSSRLELGAPRRATAR